MFYSFHCCNSANIDQHHFCLYQQKIEYRVFTDDLLKAPSQLTKFLEGRWIVILVLSSCNHTSIEIQWSHMLSTKPCARHISKIYNLLRAACGFFNKLKVDIFLKPTNIEPARADIDISLLYTPEG